MEEYRPLDQMRAAGIRSEGREREHGRPELYLDGGTIAGPCRRHWLRRSQSPQGTGGKRGEREARGDLDGWFGESYDGTVATSGAVRWFEACGSTA